MIIKKIIFFNQWRNGDCFIGKEYVRDIISRLPDVEFAYAHDNWVDIVGDLKIRHMSLREIPKFPMFMPMGYDPDAQTFYINTWPGCLINKHMGEKEHANFKRLWHMWDDVFKELNLEMRGDFMHYLPKVHWDHYDLEESKEYVNRICNKRLFLFCNGQQQSQQSSMGNMRDIVFTLATENPNCEFLLTDELDFDLPNVTYAGTAHRNMNASNVIFGPMIMGSLNKIAWISQRAELIVGKNSGPFTFSHFEDNINNPNKTFLCFSHVMKDCLLGEGEYLCNSYFSDTISNNKALDILRKLIANPTYTNDKKITCQIN
jgi:hypothetical protein